MLWTVLDKKISQHKNLRKPQFHSTKKPPSEDLKKKESICYPNSFKRALWANEQRLEEIQAHYSQEKEYPHTMPEDKTTGLFT